MANKYLIPTFIPCRTTFLETMHANIDPGTYTIRSAAQDEENLVARYIVEDRSLNPKRILNLENRRQAIFPPWAIELVYDKYELKALGAPVAPRTGHLFAFLIRDMIFPKGSELWFITPASSGDGYIITNATNVRTGWVLDRQKMSQVQVKELSGEELPEERWFLTKLD